LHQVGDYLQAPRHTHDDEKPQKEGVTKWNHGI